MIIYVSDFDLSGSGYMNIAVSLCNQLVARDHGVLALGLGYDRREHPHDFTIVPAQLRDIMPMVRNLQASGLTIDALVVALDIPLQEKLLEQFNAPCELNYIGLFPIEAGPLCGPWAMSLLRMDARLVMSQFGVAELAAVGVESEFIPIGLDFDAWRVPHPGERAQLRAGLGIEDDTFVVLTVADNQERKNLSRSLEIFKDFSEKRKAIYWLVTRPRSPVGWKLEDYAMRLGIFDRVQIYERGMPQRNLWSLYAAADAMLLASKAEGLAMPILEAMACRLPCVGTRCAAIEEHLSGGQGLLIEPDYVMCDPWGNSNRYLAGRDDGAYKLRLWDVGMSNADNAAMLDKAEAYARARVWDAAGDVLMGAIERAKALKTPVAVEAIQEIEV